MMDWPSAIPTPARGVYWARGTEAGHPVAFAIDSRGDVVQRIKLPPIAGLLDQGMDFLHAYLDAVDPIDRGAPARPRDVKHSMAPRVRLELVP